MTDHVRRSVGGPAVPAESGTAGTDPSERRPEAYHTRWVDGVAVHERRRGSGPVLLFVHGGSHASWWATGTLMPRLAGRARPVAALDWLNHGESARTDDFAHRGLPDVADREVAGVLRSYHRPVVLVGHSMGGLAALRAAARDDGRLAGLVLLAPVTPAGVPGFRPPVPGIRAGRLYGPPPFVLARRTFLSGLSRTEARRMYARLTPESPVAVRQAGRHPVDVDLDAVRCPVLVVSGTRDVLVPHASARRLANILGADFVPVPRAGHNLWSGPEWTRVADGVHGWLARRL